MTVREAQGGRGAFLPFRICRGLLDFACWLVGFLIFNLSMHAVCHLRILTFSFALHIYKFSIHSSVSPGTVTGSFTNDESE